MVGTGDSITMKNNYITKTAGRGPALSGKTLLHAASDAGVDAPTARRLFPQGGDSLVEWLDDWADRQMLEAAAPEDLGALPVRRRIAWLVRERGAVRLYGSGLVSSRADAAHALGGRCERRPFALDAVLAQPYVIDRLQDVLFVLDSFDQLWDAVETMDRLLRA